MPTRRSDARRGSEASSDLDPPLAEFVDHVAVEIAREYVADQQARTPADREPVEEKVR